MKVIAFCLVAVLLLQLASEGEGVCCHGKGPLWKSMCADCSKGTPYCPHGRSCNVFGCNCDGGCRTGLCHLGQDYYPVVVNEEPQDYYPAVLTEEQPQDNYPPIVPEEQPQDNYPPIVPEEQPQDNYPPIVTEEQPQDNYPPIVTEEQPSTAADENSLNNEDDYLKQDDMPETTAEDIIQDADENGDGLMDADEAESYLYKRGLTQSSYRIKRSLYELDVNNDNYITADELDPYQ